MSFGESSIRYLRNIAVEIEPEAIKLINNWVLVKIEEDFVDDFRKLKSGLYVDVTWKKEENAIITGTVAKVPNKLVYRDVPVDSVSVVDGRAYTGTEAISEFDADMELQVGDFIYYHYLSFERATDLNMLFLDKKGNVYILVRYDKIRCVIRDKKVIPVNGFILVEKTVQPLTYNSKFVHLIGNKNVSENVGIAKYVGKPIRKYFSHVSRNGEKYRDTGFVLPGDVLFFWGATNINNEITRTGDFDYLHCQEANIVAIVRGGEIFLNAYCYQVEKIELQESKIIHYTNKKSPWVFAKVINACLDHPEMVGKHVFYQRTYDLKFDYDGKEYNFVFNAFYRTQLFGGEIILQD